MSYNTDTIAAIATGMTNSGIGIIRVSGPEAIKILDELFQSKNKNKKLSEVKTYTAHYGYIYDDNDIIDEVIVLVMKSPHSYTTENTVEINCHGGTMVMMRILEILIKKGARPAEPGEFTKRAFLNGRIDLSKAEAVMDIIQSKNEYALKNSVKQLSGNLYDKIKNIRDNILFEIARIEASLDDPEHMNMDDNLEEFKVKVHNIYEELSSLALSYKTGKLLKEGIQTVILGKPNAGKSSILNILVGEEKAIVTNIAGTTRDVIEEDIQIAGISIHVIDTAGIRDTEDVIEKIGVEKAKEKANQADFIIYVVDSSIPLDENDKEIIQLIMDKQAVILLNKTDLNTVVTKDCLKSISDKNIIEISALNKTGLDDLETYIKNMFLENKIVMNDEIFISNVRHKVLIEEACQSLRLVKKSIEQQLPEDFYSIDFMNAYSSLGKIIGEETDDDLVNEIFGKFCMGK